MSFTHYLFQYLLIAPRVLLLVVLVALIGRRLYLQFPIFTAFVVQEIFQSFVMIALIESPTTSGDKYTLAYTIAFAVRTVFSFGVLYEIFTYMFRNYVVVERLGKLIFRGTAIVLILV